MTKQWYEHLKLFIQFSRGDVGDFNLDRVKTVTNISTLSSKHFISNNPLQHRCRLQISYYMGRIQFKDSKYMLNIYMLTYICSVLIKRNKPPYPIFLFPVLTPGKRLPRPGLSNGLTPGDGVGCFIGVGNPIPGDGVGVAN